MSAQDDLTADVGGVILPCPRCQRPNRVPFARLHEAGRCGSCKTTLPFPALPVDIASASCWTALIRSASLPIIVDFWAPWCGPCLAAAPEVKSLAARAAGDVLVVKVNTEAQPEIAGAMNIRSIPTFVVFAAGRELARKSGAMAAPELARLHPSRRRRPTGGMMTPPAP
jgi:thioredoxin 2